MTSTPAQQRAMEGLSTFSHCYAAMASANKGDLLYGRIHHQSKRIDIPCSFTVSVRIVEARCSSSLCCGLQAAMATTYSGLDILIVCIFPSVVLRNGPIPLALKKIISSWVPERGFQCPTCPIRECWSKYLSFGRHA
jgi:hypothetical protein